LRQTLASYTQDYQTRFAFATGYFIRQRKLAFARLAAHSLDDPVRPKVAFTLSSFLLFSSGPLPSFLRRLIQNTKAPPCWQALFETILCFSLAGLKYPFLPAASCPSAFPYRFTKQNQFHRSRLETIL
jgi:hypothetical protein